MENRNPELSRLERKVLSLARGLASQGIKVLELAAGRGTLSAALAGFGLKVTALDIHPGQFETTRPGVQILASDLSRPLPFADSCYELVICCEGIEHLEHQYRFARELARVIKPGGRLILTTPNITNIAGRLRFLLTGFYPLAVRPSSEFKRDRTIEHIYPLTFWQLRHILHTSGLIIERITTDHIRRSGLAFAPLFPLSYLLTLNSLRSEKEPFQRRANFEIAGQMHTPALFFGRTQIVVARKKESTYDTTPW
ncbi:MAG: class I SAM-dependent methyltransferase [Gemmatimonadota bacterium]|nr:class I SAM-dependent methyltransferase [Gemmatimonadota bacterium]